MGQLLFMLILSMATISFGVKWKLEYTFKYPQFYWQSQKQMKNAIRSGNYNKTKCVMYDVDQANDGTTYVTIPRKSGLGTPATLVEISDQSGPGGPLLLPFPNWDWHNSTECQNIINAYSIKVVCNHIFIMDTGKIGTNKICDPKLLVFDLSNKKLVDNFTFPNEIATGNKTGAGSLVSPVVYIPGQSVSGCSRVNESIVFVADGKGSALVIYHQNDKRVCRIESKYMKPTKNNFIIGNQSINYKAGISGLTIIGDELYYFILSGMNVYKANISELVKCPNGSDADKIIKLVGDLSSQPGAIASTHHAIFLSNMQEASILGVSPLKTPFDSKSMTVLGKHSKELQAVTGLKALSRKLIGISTDPRFYKHTANLTETSIRIFSMDLIEICKQMYPY